VRDELHDQRAQAGSERPVAGRVRLAEPDDPDHPQDTGDEQTPGEHADGDADGAEGELEGSHCGGGLSRPFSWLGSLRPITHR
jgi:hypothetical protein